MNKNIDIPLDSLNQPGNLWINEKTKQLRYSLDKNTPSSWLHPLSIYQVGNNSTTPKEYFIKRGQPLSIGFIDELSSELRVSGDPCVVPTNPYTHQWCIGVSLEPGNADRMDGSLDHIHVLSQGQIEYHLNDNREEYYQPPNENDKYLWTYEDIGKPVMVSNYPGKEGELTIDITHAYFNGANIITVGRIADAPVPSNTLDEQKIIIEVQLAGDTRGMIDSTQFSANLSEDIPLDKEGNRIVYHQIEDKLIFVKLIDDPNSNRGIGIMITSDEVLLEGGGTNSPVGAFLAKSKDGEIKLEDYAGKTVLIHRLGIVGANFNLPDSDVGKDLYLNNGNVTTAGTADSYEYKVGVVIETNRILVDCRYPRIFKNQEMIGKIKPAYVDRTKLGDPDAQILADPGYVVIDKNIVHKINGAWDDDEQYPLVDFSELIKIIMYQGIIIYSENETGPFIPLKGTIEDPPGLFRTLLFDDIKDGFFKFRDTFYSLDGEISAQIKFSNEGAPDNIDYIWPEMYFQAKIPIGRNYWDVNNSPISFNINYLYNLGVYIDGNGNNIEAYEITCRIQNGRYLSPGFYSTKDEDDNIVWCGYEWAVIYDPYQQAWFLKMITNPGGTFLDSVPSASVYGFCYPPGRELSYELPIEVIVRRRPVQYHNLFLNQLNTQSPWKPHTTGNDLVTDNTLYFGTMHSGIVDSNNETYWALDMRGANSMSFFNYNKSDAGYKKLLKYVIGPYYESDLLQTERVNQLEIHYQAVTFKNEFITGHTIRWLYDFDENKVFLGSDFGPKLISYPTTKDISGNIIERQTIVHEDYIDGATSDNISGYYRTTRSALKTLHEIPVQFFNYADDINIIHKRIHTVQEAWDISGNSTQRYQPADFEREIFPPISGDTLEYVEGTKYTYASDPYTLLPSSQKEWEHIVEEINYLFNTIERDNLGNLVTGGDVTYIHTNLGLLNQGSKETQDRLLRIERSLFGPDYEYLPDGVNFESDYNYYNPINKTLHTGAIAREVQFLYDQELIRASGQISPISNNHFNLVSGFWSDYKTILWNLYGNYRTLDEYISNGISSGYIPDENNYFHKMYIWFLKANVSKGKHFNIENYQELYPSQTQGISQHNNEALYDARNIFFNKFYSGYYTEGSGKIFPSKTYPFAWPLSNQANINIDIRDAFFKSNVMGFSDTSYYMEPDDPTIHKIWSVDSQSLEGIMLDTIAKLSWIRTTFEDQYYQYSSDFVNVFPRDILTVVPSRNPINKIERIPRKLKDSVKHTDKNNLFYLEKFSGYFSQFSMISGKMHNSFGSEIIPNYLPNTFGNIERNDNHNLHLKSKVFKRFEETVKNTNLEISLWKETDYNGMHLKREATTEIYFWSLPYNLGQFSILDGGGTNIEDLPSNPTYTPCAIPPEGWYEGRSPDIGFVRAYFDPDTLKLYIGERFSYPPFDNYSSLQTLYQFRDKDTNALRRTPMEDIYHHFPSWASGKVPYAPQQYIEVSGLLQIPLGRFVMASGFDGGPNNEWFFNWNTVQDKYAYYLDTPGHNDVDIPVVSGPFTSNGTLSTTNGTLSAQTINDVPVTVSTNGSFSASIPAGTTMQGTFDDNGVNRNITINLNNAITVNITPPDYIGRIENNTNIPLENLNITNAVTTYDGNITHTSGRLLSRTTEIVSVLNEKPVILRESFQDIPGWVTNAAGTTIDQYFSGHSMRISGIASYNNNDYFNSVNIQKYRNSGIIYGIHLTDDIDMNVRIKKQEQLVNSMRIGINLDPVDHALIYDRFGFFSLPISASYYTNGTLFEVQEDASSRNLSYSLYGSVPLKSNSNQLYFPIKRRIILDGPKFFIRATDPLKLFILPGISPDIIWVRGRCDTDTDNILVPDPSERLRAIVTDVQPNGTFNVNNNSFIIV